jgi:hypothetical protein
LTFGCARSPFLFIFVILTIVLTSWVTLRLRKGFLPLGVGE